VTAGAPTHATARQLVEVTLALIESRGGLRAVNLREVARHAKCSHANVYNYFDSFADLLWATLDLAIARLIAHTEAALQARSRPGEIFRVFIDSQIDFALQHPGIYRFIWLDTLSGVPPAYVAERIRATPILFATTLRESLAPKASIAVATRATRMVHGYLHGEICKLICARAVDPLASESLSSSSSPRVIELARRTMNEDVHLLATMVLSAGARR